MDAGTISNVIVGIIPLVVPILVAGVKHLVPRIPKKYIPILTPILGAAIAVLAHFQSMTWENALVGAVLGAVGVFVREVHKQFNEPA